MKELNGTEKKDGKDAGTMINRDTFGIRQNESNAATYSKRELMELINRYYPQYSDSDSGEK